MVNKEGHGGSLYLKPLDAWKSLEGEPFTNPENDVEEIHSLIHPLHLAQKQILPNI